MKITITMTDELSSSTYEYDKKTSYKTFELLGEVISFLEGNKQENHRKIIPSLSDIPKEVQTLSSEQTKDGKRKKKRNFVSYTRLDREVWQIILDDIHNGRNTKEQVVETFGVGKSTLDVKYKNYVKNNLIYNGK